MIRLDHSPPKLHKILWILPLFAMLGGLWAWVLIRPGTATGYERYFLTLLIASALVASVIAIYDAYCFFHQEKALRASDVALQGVITQLPIGMAVADQSGKITWINQKGLDILDMPMEVVTLFNWMNPDLLMLMSDGSLMDPADRPLNKVFCTKAIVQDVVVGLEQPLSGNWIWVSFTAEPRLDVAGEVSQVILTFEDVTQKQKAIAELAKQHFRDPLTNLPNRVLLMERLSQALARLARSRLTAAVLFMDLDRFKLINESLGHNAGDQLLVQVAQRLQACIRPEDTVARLGGDDFVLVVEDLGTKNDVLRVAERVARVMEPPFNLPDRDVHTTCSMGIAVASTHRYSPGDMLRDAEVAMYRAKSKGEGSIELFDPSMNEQAMKRFQTENELRRAIEQREFVLYYQPLISFQSGDIEGWEALVRWRHPEKGMVPPLEFIGLAEETGLIVPIGKWVLEEAIRQASIWQQRFPCEVPRLMNVNISGRQFQHRDLVTTVTRALNSSQLDPACLKLEITESVMMKDPLVSLEAMKLFRSLNIHLVIDDFGTGYSSLSYLKRFPVDTLKIDKSFVDGLGKDAESTAIVGAVISLAKSLGMRVTAEGIETVEQVQYLKLLGCDQGQGYYFSRPVSATDAEMLMVGTPSW